MTVQMVRQGVQEVLAVVMLPITIQMLVVSSEALQDLVFILLIRMRQVISL